MQNEIQNDLTDKFSKGIIIIHWVSALLIFALFFLGLSMADLDAKEKMVLLKPHAALGLLLFILTVVRSVMFFSSKRPADLKTGSRFNDKLAVGIHNAFYILLLIVGASGIATMIIGGYGDALQTGDLTLIKASEEIGPLKAHGLRAYLIMVLVALHIIGMVKHFVLTRENTLKRIF